MKKILVLALLSVFLIACQDLTGKAGQIPCKDTDGGNLYTFGRAADHKTIIYDKCGPTQGQKQIIYEAICMPEGATYVSYMCPQGCFNGMCIP